jgi:hypothetical protein
MGNDEYEDGTFDKTLGQYRLALNNLMHPLRKYGQGAYVDGVIEELVHLSVQLHLKLCGVDIPFEYRDIHW